MSHDMGAKLAKQLDERDDHIQGSSTAVATLVEYGDYQCENSGAAQSVVKEVRQRSGDWLRFAFRHFPLAKAHEHAQYAAEAAEAAGAQGMFWEMHDYLFEHQDQLDDESLVQYAEVIGLDVDQFVRDLSEHTFAGRVDGDVRSGVRGGIDSTPAFFINEIRYSGPIEVDAMLGAIEAASDSSED